MSNDLFNISLNQGKNFNNYQTKIKQSVTNKSVTKQSVTKQSVNKPPVNKNIPNGNSFSNSFGNSFGNSFSNSFGPSLKEGFSTSVQNQKRGTPLTSSSDVDELNRLQAQYNILMQQYTTIQKSIGDSSLETIDRFNSNNPYLNKTIKFNTGNVCYVTAQGIVKYIQTQDIWNSTNAPKEYIDINLPWLTSYSVPGTTIPTTPTLISGTPVKLNESLGNEGTNVYASKLINNPSSAYIGCYNDFPPSTDTLLVPVMGSTNEVNGFTATASSIYENNNDFTGPWCAFDNNINTWWHSNIDSNCLYNSTTGQYVGNSSLNVIGSNGETTNILGEWLQISFPNQSLTTVTKYSIQGRQGCCGQPNGRDPNTWYLLGLKDNQWIQVDYQSNISFNWKMLTFNIANPQPCSAYAIITTVAGDSASPAGNRSCVQIATWNLFANSLSSSDSRAMIWNPSSIGYTTLDKCQEYAVDNGYQYFGLQDYKSDGTSACLVSNDITRTQMYGDASNQVTIIPIWESNTTGSSATHAKLGGRGRFVLADDSGNTIWQSAKTDPANCAIQYSFSELSDASGNVLNHYKDTTLDKCQQLCTDNKDCYGFSMNSDSNNECWLKSQFKRIKSSTNRGLYAKNGKQKCTFVLILQDDGNLCIYQGTPENVINPAVWCTMSNGKQLQPNSDWEASKSSFGRNYIIGGEALSINQWIGSNNGSTKLIMQSDGNLVLYTSESKPGCVTNDKTYGNAGINAVYKLNSSGNKDSLGKVSYIDSESMLKEYPDSMLGYTNNYQIYQNTDTVGNDIASMIVQDESQCQLNCNNNSSCAAYVYMPSSTTCWLKNNAAYPKGTKQPNNNVNLGVRQPGLKNSKNCSNKIVEIDTVQYDNYLKGDPMTQDTKCNTQVVSQEDRIIFDNIKSQLFILGQDIASKMERLYNQDNKIYEKLNMNSAQFNKDLEKYKNINIKIKQELDLQSNNNNIEGMHNMNDINGMLSDTDLIVLQANYKYIMWSILAVGLLTITINVIKK